MNDIKLRSFYPPDTDALIQIMTQSVRAIETNLYSPEQKNAWHLSIYARNSADWMRYFNRNSTFVLTRNHVPAAFISFSTDGYIDLLYSAPNQQRLGHASRLLQEAVCCIRAGKTLRVCASLAALPFFLNHQFNDLGLQVKKRFGIALPCHSLYRML